MKTQISNGVNKKIIIILLVVITVALLAFIVFDNGIFLSNENSAVDGATRSEERRVQKQEVGNVSSESQTQNLEIQTQRTGNVSPPPSIAGFPKMGDVSLTPPVEEFAIEKPGAKLRIFDLVIGKGKFIPDRIVVNQGDRIQFNIKTDEDTADIESQQLSFSMKATKGKTEFLSLPAQNSGVFQFSCRDFCPGGMRFWGEIIVLEKQ